MITLTPAAAEKIMEFFKNTFDNEIPETAGIRVRVVPGGCSGFQYRLEIDEEPESSDIVVKAEGINIFIDPLSQPYLQNVKMDFEQTIMGDGFTFKNPNATGSCGCGSSFTV